MKFSLICLLTCLLIFPGICWSEDIEDFLKKWKDVQEKGDVEGYIALCSDEFKTTTSYETVVNDLLPNNLVQSIDIDHDQIGIIAQIDRIIASPIPYVIETPDQSQRESLKHLELIRDQTGHLKIKEEKFASLPPDSIIQHALLNMDALSTSFTDQLIIEQLLEGWRTAWENKALTEFMTYYHDGAEIVKITIIDGQVHTKTLTKMQLQQGMSKLFERFSWIDVTIENVSVYGDSLIMKADFTQTFAGRNEDLTLAYQDLGQKNLTFTRDDVGDWKIRYEREEKVIDLDK